MNKFILLMLTSLQLQAADLQLEGIKVTDATKPEEVTVQTLATRTRYSVYIALDKDCPILQKYIPALNELHDKYSSQKLSILFISRSSNLSAKLIAEFINTYKIKPAVYLDQENKLLKALGITTIAQSVLVDNKSMSILYSGRIDDKVNYDSVKISSKNNYLEDAIISTLAGKKIKVKHIKTLGCAI